jgi:hypothetical protein
MERDCCTRGEPLTELVVLSRAILKETEPTPAEARKTRLDVRRHPEPERRYKMYNQSMLGGLLDPKSSSLSLTALAQAAASSGKRLVVEIRDETPVKIVRTSTKGL